LVPEAKSSYKDIDTRNSIILTSPSVEKLTGFKQSDEMVGDKVIGIGGGQVMDAAKAAGHNLQLPIVLVPSCLSTDSMFTNAYAIRKGGIVRYQNIKPKKVTIMDLELLSQAPVELNRCGFFDIFSAYTAINDGILLTKMGGVPDQSWVAKRNQMLNICSVCRITILAFRSNSIFWLKSLGDSIAEEARVTQDSALYLEEGSEHFFAYCFENHCSEKFYHGEAVALGMLYMIQKQYHILGKRSVITPDEVTEILILLGMEERMKELAPYVEETLDDLPGYTKRHRLPPTVIDWEFEK